MPRAMATNRPGVFAGGDAVTGTTWIVDAIAAGHRAARGMDNYLRGLRGEPAVAAVADVPAVKLTAGRGRDGAWSAAR